MSQIRAIQLRRGTKAELNAYGNLLIGELGFCTDTGELYIGAPSGNKLINPSDIDWSKVTNKPSTFAPASHSHAWSDITGKPSSFTPASHTHGADQITETTNKRFMTDAERSKLSGIEAGAQVNKVTSVAGKTGAVTLAKSDVGLGNVQNYGIATQAQAEAGTADNVYMTPLKTAQAIAKLGGGTLFPVVAGNTTLCQSSVGTKASSTTARKLFSQQIIFPIEGDLRISMYMEEIDGVTNYIQVYRNGVAVGNVNSFSAGGSGHATQTVVEDVPGWRQGDILEIYGWVKYNGEKFALGRVTLLIGYGGN